MKRVFVLVLPLAAGSGLVVVADRSHDPRTLTSWRSALAKNGQRTNQSALHGVVTLCSRRCREERHEDQAPAHIPMIWFHQCTRSPGRHGLINILPHRVVR